MLHNSCTMSSKQFSLLEYFTSILKMNWKYHWYQSVLKVIHGRFHGSRYYFRTEIVFFRNENLFLLSIINEMRHHIFRSYLRTLISLHRAFHCNIKWSENNLHKCSSITHNFTAVLSECVNRIVHSNLYLFSKLWIHAIIQKKLLCHRTRSQWIMKKFHFQYSVIRSLQFASQRIRYSCWSLSDGSWKTIIYQHNPHRYHFPLLID